MPAVQVDSPSALSALLTALFARLGATTAATTTLFSLLARFSNLIYRLIARTSNDPDSWSSTLLPPLVALLAAYLSLVVAYRTLRSTVRLVWFGVKWGTVLGIALALWAWWVGEQGAIESEGVPSARRSWFSQAQDIGTLGALAGPLLAALQTSTTSSSSSSNSRRGNTPRTPDVDVASLLGTLAGRSPRSGVAPNSDSDADSDDDIQAAVLDALQRAAQSGLGLGTLGRAAPRHRQEGLATRLVRGLFGRGSPAPSAHDGSGTGGQEGEEWQGTLWTWLEALADGDVGADAQGQGQRQGRAGTTRKAYQRRAATSGSGGPARNTRSRTAAARARAADANGGAANARRNARGSAAR